MNTLITITAPSMSGKSTLLAELDKLGVGRIVSTTTRAPRVGEVEGHDYYYISTAKSLEMEANGEFAELVTFNNTRYGVTHLEMDRAFDKCGLAAIIVEPKGKEQYRHLGDELGFKTWGVYVCTSPRVRVERLNARLIDEINGLILDVQHDSDLANDYGSRLEKIVKATNSRIFTTLTEEEQWFSDGGLWDQFVSGEDPTAEQAALIFAQASRHAKS